MGRRLGKAIGEQRLQEILRQAESGKLVRVREAALYFNHDGTSQHIPAEAFDVNQARELLLFAIEVFDDALVGMTNKSMELGRDADALFARWNSV